VILKKITGKKGNYATAMICKVEIYKEHSKNRQKRTEMTKRTKRTKRTETAILALKTKKKVKLKMIFRI